MAEGMIEDTNKNNHLGVDIVNDKLYKFLMSNKKELNVQNDDYILNQFYKPLKTEEVDWEFLCSNNENDIKEALKDCGFKTKKRIQLINILKNSTQSKIYETKNKNTYETKYDENTYETKDEHTEMEQSTTQQTVDNQHTNEHTTQDTQVETHTYTKIKYGITVLILILAIGLGIFINATPAVSIQCPHFNHNNTLYISSITQKKTLSATYMENIEYEWTIDEIKSDGQCSHSFHNESTNNLQLEFESCKELQLNINLLMNSVVSKWNFYSNNVCEFNLHFYEDTILGVDLGTTYSCIAYQKDKINAIGRRHTEAIVVDKKAMEYCIPSAVYFGQNMEILIGKSAMKKLKDDPKNVIYDIKRIIGRSSNDIAFTTFKRNHIFNITYDNKRVIIPNWNKTLLFEQILSIILTHLIEIGSNDWGANKQIKMYAPNIVVSVPALFHNGQRKGVRSSCHLSGLNPMKLLVEPSAASLTFSYYNKKPNDKFKSFLAFDFGGGTLDVSLMRCTGVHCTVLSVYGHTSLGGRDFDNVIRDIIIDNVKQYGWNISNIQLYSLIMDKSEQIKIDLSSLDEYNLLLDNPETGQQKSILITRKMFETHSKTVELINSVLNVVNISVIGSGHKWSNIRMILMIGGSSHIPIVKNSLHNTFGIELVFSNDISPTLLVTYGCGITGGSLMYNQFNNYQSITSMDVVLDEIIPQSIGFETCVADLNSKTFKDCGRMEKVLFKDQRYPTYKTITRCQEPPDANTLLLKIFEGDNMYVKYNYYLGNITIKNVKPRDKNICDNIIINFIVDNDGIFKVEAWTNQTYGNVEQYEIEIASENSKHGTITKEETIQLAQNMIAWYNVDKYPLFRKYFNQYPELSQIHYPLSENF